jgi:hypothetical protein
MSTVNENQDHRERSWLYITCWVVLIALVVGGLIAFRSATETKNANDKADQLITELKAAGARTPDKDQIVRVLGDDGGATCADPNDALSRSILLSQLTNGATGPGARPVIADSRVFKGQLLIIKIYCPDELDDFQAYVDNLKTDDVASD